MDLCLIYMFRLIEIDPPLQFPLQNGVHNPTWSIGRGQLEDTSKCWATPKF